MPAKSILYALNLLWEQLLNKPGLRKKVSSDCTIPSMCVRTVLHTHKHTHAQGLLFLHHSNCFSLDLHPSYEHYPSLGFSCHHGRIGCAAPELKTRLFADQYAVLA